MGDPHWFTHTTHLGHEVAVRQAPAHRVVPEYGVEEGVQYHLGRFGRGRRRLDRGRGGGLDRGTHLGVGGIGGCGHFQPHAAAAVVPASGAGGRVQGAVKGTAGDAGGSGRGAEGVGTPGCNGSVFSSRP